MNVTHHGGHARTTRRARLAMRRRAMTADHARDQAAHRRRVAHHARLRLDQPAPEAAGRGEPADCESVPPEQPGA